MKIAAGSLRRRKKIYLEANWKLFAEPLVFSLGGGEGEGGLQLLGHGRLTSAEQRLS
jgi:hypothetical protein